MKSYGLGSKLNFNITVPELIKLLEKIEEDGDHWMWKGRHNIFGYGNVSFRGKYEYIHRLFFVIFKGNLPYGYDVHHKKLCGRKLCCNPAHMKKLPHEDHAKVTNRHKAEEKIPF